MSLCNRCGREESEENPFPRWTKTICKECDANRKAAWYWSKHAPREKSPKVEVDRDAQTCQGCGEIFSYPRVKQFCDSCISRHERDAREAKKQDKSAYDHQYRADGHRGPKSEKEKEHNREYMREYRGRKKS